MITKQEVVMERLKKIAGMEVADTRFTFKPMESKSLITDIDVESLYPTFALDFSVPTNVVDVVHREILNYITNDIYTTKEAIKTMRNSIKKIIFNDPATIIIWGNGDKTIVKCGEGETYDDVLKHMDILQEECAELIKALYKYKRSLGHYTSVDPIDNIIEEITHVAISSEIVARLLSITPDDIQKEINKKATKFNLKKGENND